jgi:hypothetical protein
MGEHKAREPGEAVRGLTAPGPSKVGVDAAMRARDVSRRDAPAPESRAQSSGGEGSGGSSPDSS